MNTPRARSARQSVKPAIAGGTPVRQKRLPYGRHTITEEDVDAVSAALRSDWLTTGPTVPKLEEALRRRIGAADVVVVSSGTAALHAATAAAGIGPGDEVILPPLTFVASANAVVYQQGIPVFADIDAQTLMLDAVGARAAITPRTKAIMTVHYAGAPANTEPLRELADARALRVIEDAAHALGATAPNGPIGANSQLATFSFHPVKLMTTGEGGAVATNSPDLASFMRTFRNHGVASDSRQRESTGSWRYEMTQLGYNYRLTDIGAALGLAQLGRIDAFLARRRAIAKRYLEILSADSTLCFPVADPERHAWHIFPMLLNRASLNIDRDGFVRAMRKEGIAANVHYDPVHLHPFYRARYGHRPGEFPIAEDAAARLVTLPVFPLMENTDVDDVVTAVQRLVDWFRA